MSVVALVVPVDMEVCSLASSPVLGTSPRLGADFLASSPRIGADFLASSPRLGADFLSEIHCRPWPEPRRGLLNGMGCLRRSPTPDSDDERDQRDGEEDDDRVRMLRSILVAEGRTATARDKRVVFADDRGLPLVQVRRMQEPSNMPPRWTAKFLQRVTGLAPPPPQPKHPTWTLHFSQPAADYTRFCEQLDSCNVALEHALYKPTDIAISGTVKVKNLHFEKQVFVRVSDDNWRSSRDVPATYVPPTPCPAAAAAPYDRFAFSFPLPDRNCRVHFCVCFRCPSGEFWDNNGGRNFSVSRSRVPRRSSSGVPDRDIYHAEVDDWSSFCSWGDEYSGAPYY